MGLRDTRLFPSAGGDCYHHVSKPRGRQMRRRDLLKVFAGWVATWPRAVYAQKTVPVIGYLSGRSPDTEAALRTPFLKGLEAAGFVVGRDVLIEYRFAEGNHDRLRGLAAELVRR